MGQKESFQTHSLNTSAQLLAEGVSGTSPKPQHRPYWLLGPPNATSKARAALRSEQPIHLPTASGWSCITDTMQPHAILLLFFFPGTTAEPEGKWEPWLTLALSSLLTNPPLWGGHQAGGREMELRWWRAMGGPKELSGMTKLGTLPPALFPSPAGSHMLKLLHFATFQNSTSVLVGGLGLLGDVKMGSLDSRTGNIRYYRPWLRPSLPKGDWDVIESSIKSYVRDFSRLVQMYTAVPCTCPFPTPFPRFSLGHEGTLGIKLQYNKDQRSHCGQL